MGQYLYRIQPTRAAMLSEGATEYESAKTSEHFSYLKELVEQGVVILAGRTLNTDPSSFGIVVFNADSDAAAQAIVDADPAVVGGVMRAALFPYRVALLEGANVR
jgi:uncharacterized protein YciI